MADDIINPTASTDPTTTAAAPSSDAPTTDTAGGSTSAPTSDGSTPAPVGADANGQAGNVSDAASTSSDAASGAAAPAPVDPAPGVPAGETDSQPVGSADPSATGRADGQDAMTSQGQDAAATPAPDASVPAATDSAPAAASPASTDASGEAQAGAPAAEQDNTAPGATIPQATQPVPMEHPAPAENPLKVDPRTGLPLPDHMQPNAQGADNDDQKSSDAGASAAPSAGSQDADDAAQSKVDGLITHLREVIRHEAHHAKDLFHELEEKISKLLRKLQD